MRCRIGGASPSMPTFEAASLVEASVGDADTSNAPSNSDTEGDAPPILQRYESLINALARAIAPQLLPQLDRAVVAEVRSSVTRPMTTIECVAVLSELGLKPADPAALLDMNIAGLLPADDNQTDLGE